MRRSSSRRCSSSRQRRTFGRGSSSVLWTTSTRLSRTWRSPRLAVRLFSSSTYVRGTDEMPPRRPLRPRQPGERWKALNSFPVQQLDAYRAVRSRTWKYSVPCFMFFVCRRVGVFVAELCSPVPVATTPSQYARISHGCGLNLLHYLPSRPPLSYQADLLDAPLDAVCASRLGLRGP